MRTTTPAAARAGLEASHRGKGGRERLSRKWENATRSTSFPPTPPLSPEKRSDRSTIGATSAIDAPAITTTVDGARARAGARGRARAPRGEAAMLRQREHADCLVH